MLFLGCTHTCFDDFQGKERIKHVLSVRKPNIITVEWPESANAKDYFTYNEEYKQVAREVIAKTNIPQENKEVLLEFIKNMGHDTAAVLEYAAETGAQTYLIDSVEQPPASKIGEGLAQMLLEHHNYGFPTTRLRKQLLEKLKTPPRENNLSPALLESLQIRDTYMAERINMLHPDIHIGGLAHATYPASEHYRSLITLAPFTEIVTIVDAFDYEPGNPRFAYPSCLVR